MSARDELEEAGARALAECDGITWDEARAPQGDDGTMAEAYAVASEATLDAYLARPALLVEAMGGGRIGSVVGRIGGGMVDVLVDRDLMQYPSLGTAVLAFPSQETTK